MTRQLDFENELAIVIGKKGRHIPEEKAYEYVAGYTIFNDICARDLQLVRSLNDLEKGNRGWLKGRVMTPLRR